jgi:hypothetical protein
MLKKLAQSIFMVKLCGGITGLTDHLQRGFNINEWRPG